MKSKTPPSSVGHWENACTRFETPEQERAKFVKRLRALGVQSWDKELLITELFCGRGNVLYAWQELGFHNVEGLDISQTLLAQYSGTARTYVGDATDLPFPNASRSVISVQGGLHHLTLPDGLKTVLTEIHRVLGPEGKVLLVEPWMTPFLRLAHAACRIGVLRNLWSKLDALAIMIEHEQDTYEDWLHHPKKVLNAISRIAEPRILRIGWGKLYFVGIKKTPGLRF
jgi:SAM-dependent methyltransferase